MSLLRDFKTFNWVDRLKDHGTPMTVQVMRRKEELAERKLVEDLADLVDTHGPAKIAQLYQDILEKRMNHNK